MAVVPSRAILHGAESVCVRFSGCNWTLGHAIDSIHLQGAELSQAVPMDRCSIEQKIILDSYLWSYGQQCILF
jgi:hypothetical protein